MKKWKKLSLKIEYSDNHEIRFTIGESEMCGCQASKLIEIMAEHFEIEKEIPKGVYF